MRKIKKIECESLRFLKPAVEAHPNNQMQLEFLLKENAVAVLLLDAKGEQVFLVKQYRPGVGKELYEIPAGLIESEENPLSACIRELEEESGYRREQYDILYDAKEAYCVSPGYTEEKLYFYIFQLKEGEMAPKKSLNLDEGEELSGKWFPLEALKPNQSHTIDLKSIFAFLLWQELKQKIKA